MTGASSAHDSQSPLLPFVVGSRMSSALALFHLCPCLGIWVGDCKGRACALYHIAMRTFITRSLAQSVPRGCAHIGMTIFINVFYQHMFLTLAHGCASLLPRPPISCRNCFSPLNFPKWARSAMSLEKTSVEEMINTKPVYRLKTSAPPSSDPLEQKTAGGSSSSSSPIRAVSGDTSVAATPGRLPAC